MATTTISITLDAYKRLAALKKARESFSDVINRVTRKQDIMKLAGALSEEGGRRLDRGIEKVKRWRKKGDQERRERMRRMFK